MNVKLALLFSLNFFVVSSEAIAEGSALPGKNFFIPEELLAEFVPERSAAADGIRFSAFPLSESGSTFKINTGKFLVEINAEGDVIAKTPVDVAPGSWTLTTSELIDGALPAAMESGGLSPAKLETTEAGAPLPPGGLKGEALKVQQACLQVADEKIEEARLMDSVSGNSEFTGLLSYQNQEIVSFLIERRGVKAQDVDAAYLSFVQEAKRRKKLREEKYDREWGRVIVSHEFVGVPYKVEGPAEQMGRYIGPPIANGLYSVGVGGIGKAYGYGVAFVAGAGAFGTPIGDYGAEAGGAYGHFIDRTGQNPFFTDMNGGRSPRPNKSVLDSMREAFDKVWSD